MINSGDRFGMLTVIKKCSRVLTKSGSTAEFTWLCICDCGKEKEGRRTSLQNGGCRSCGCLTRERAKKMCKSGGKPRNRKGAYSSWAQMRSRCNDKNANGYENYGGIGVKVCERLSSFDLFLIDMGERPDGCSIDRIDNEKGYSPDNCRWATVREQRLNRKYNVFINAYGIRKPLLDWADDLGMNPGTIRSRIRRGASDEEAVSEYEKIHNN